MNTCVASVCYFLWIMLLWILVCKYLLEHLLLNNVGCMPTSSIAGSCDNWTFIFLRNFHLALQGLAAFHTANKTCVVVATFLYFYQHLLLSIDHRHTSCGTVPLWLCGLPCKLCWAQDGVFLATLPRWMPLALRHRLSGGCEFLCIG